MGPPLEEELRKVNRYRWIKRISLFAALIAPIVGAWYTRLKMKQMEKGIHDDLKRIENKGKTLADIPRKE